MALQNSVLQGMEDAQLKQDTLDAIDACRPISGDDMAFVRRVHVERQWADAADGDTFVAVCRATLRRCKHELLIDDVMNERTA